MKHLKFVMKYYEYIISFISFIFFLLARLYRVKVKLENKSYQITHQ